MYRKNKATRAVSAVLAMLMILALTIPLYGKRGMRKRKIRR